MSKTVKSYSIIIKLYSLNIDNLDYVRFLGIHVDRALTFATHIEKLTAKLSSGCYALRSVAKELDSSAARMVYFALIESHLRYGIPFWGSCSEYLFNSVFVLQKRAMRFMFGMQGRDSCRPFFIREGIMTLPCLYIAESVCLVFKKYKHTITEGPYNTRQIHNIPLPIPATSQIRKSFIYNAKRMFNHLPVNIRCIQNLSKFGRETKRLLLRKAYYTVTEYFEDQL